MICTVSPGIPYALFDQSVSHTSDVEKFNGELVLNGFIEGAKTCLKNNIPVGLGNDVGCPWIAQYDFIENLYISINMLVQQTLKLYIPQHL